jgi:acyl dehydratase
MTASQQPRVLTSAPAAAPMMLKAALPAVPVLNLLPGIRRTGSTLPDRPLTRHDVAVDRDHVAAYSRVCGFPLTDALPVTYPHLLAFGLHMAIMTDAAFPFPAVGTVHLENALTRHRPIRPDERLQVTARAQDLRSHPRGRVFDIVSTVHSGGELVWESTSTFLRLGGGDRDADTGRVFEEASPNGTVWRLPADLGRRYAAVSGDHNPIHLYGLTAKALGFPRQIAHGMWSKARCLAALEGRLPDAVTAEVGFKKPVLLPGSVAFGSHRSGEGYAFSLTSPTTGAPHLLGRVTPA